MKIKNILSAHQFTKNDILHIISSSQKIQNILENKCSSTLTNHSLKKKELEIKRQKLSNSLKRKILCSLFFEPSTRTRISFESAMYRLGGTVININNPKSLSLMKGETITDTFLTLNNYVDIIIIRHPQKDIVSELTNISEIPIINAGNGAGEHPTQALLDILSLFNEIQDINNQEIAIIGDLKYSRTVHSLIILLSHFSVKICLISPNSLRLPEVYRKHLQRKNITFHETSDLERAKISDALYLTRLQKERFSASSLPSESLPYQINNNFLQSCKKTNIPVLHPLPRGPELHTEVDTLPNAAYFRAVRYGLYLRMSLLLLLCQSDFSCTGDK